MRLAGHFCASFHRSDALYRSSWAYLFLLYTEATLSVVTSSGSRLTRFSSWEWGWVSVRPQWIPSSPTWIDGTQKMVSSTTNSNVTYLWFYHWLSVFTCSTSFPKTTWVKTKCKAPSLDRAFKRCKMEQVQTLLPLYSLNLVHVGWLLHSGGLDGRTSTAPLQSPWRTSKVDRGEYL